MFTYLTIKISCLRSSGQVKTVRKSTLVRLSTNYAHVQSKKYFIEITRIITISYKYCHILEAKEFKNYISEYIKVFRNIYYQRIQDFKKNYNI